MAMQLFLVNNDPLHTTLLSQDGLPLYSIRSSTTLQSPLPSQPSSSPSPSPSPQSSFPPIKPLLHPGHRQPPSNAHPAIPITRTHSTPHPDEHQHYPDPSSPHPSPVLDPLPPPKYFTSSSPSQSADCSGLVTSIKRLERYQSSRGNVETLVGQIESTSNDGGTRVQLCNLGMEICAPPVQRKKCSKVNPLAPTSPHAPAPLSRNALSRTNDAGTALEAFRDFCNESQRKTHPSADEPTSAPTSVGGSNDGTNDDDFIPDPTWSFKGPDNRPYKWISLASNPVLIHDTQPPTPIACFRPAKLGIISRSRRGFLEILPPGLEKEDWIVVTFVGYFRMKLGDRIGSYTPSQEHPDTQSYPIGRDMTMMSQGVGARLKSASEPSTPSISPLRDPFTKSSSAPLLPAAYLEALRRRNRNQSPRRTW